MKVEYNHAANIHTVQGAAEALSVAFGGAIPKSLLDVGCGTGTWLRAASDLGVSDVFGVDGIIPEASLHVSRDIIRQHDLSVPFDLGRRFDVALCLEVAEHLPESTATALVSSIVAHANTVLFSAACPGQPGQRHINCQWPAYWQQHFNNHGFTCEDSVRWHIWDNANIESWYRQNIFWARYEPLKAGQEARIKSVIHPDVFHPMSLSRTLDAIQHIEQGGRPFGWYMTVSTRVMLSKLAVKIRFWK